ncbi:MAG: type II 3-dehydroquinate dehydratase [Clostridia bacterium]
MKILVINGPNLNMLGIREKDKYGSLKLDEINDIIAEYTNKNNMEVSFFQSNYEGELIEAIQNNRSQYDYYVLNAGAYTHYSYAIRDAIASIRTPVIEVHITNIFQREEFREKSVISPVCIGSISGFGYTSYLLAIDAVKKFKEG